MTNSFTIVDVSVGKTYYMSEGNFAIMGEKNSDGFTLGKNYSAGDVKPSALYNLDSKYKSLTFTIGHIDDASDGDATVNIYLDDKLAKTFDVGYESLPKEITININYANHMKIEIINPAYALYGFF